MRTHLRISRPLSNESEVKRRGRVQEAITASEGRPCVEFNPSDAKWTGRDGRGTGEEASRRWRPGDSRVS